MMKKEPFFHEDATWRNALLKYCMKNGISGEALLNTVAPLKGKTEEEKEQLAKEILEKLQRENTLET